MIILRRRTMIQKTALYSVLFLINITFSSFINAHSQLFTIMLDPAGDAEYTGRKIDDCFERGLTLQCAEKLKKVLEERYPSVRIVLTRFPGETLQLLQNANFANRLDVDFYISIHFYEEHAIKPALYLYSFVFNTDLMIKPTEFAFYPYDKAYQLSHAVTRQCADLMSKQLIGSYQHQFDVKGPYELPCSPLIGVKSPAIMCEIGLKTKDSWIDFVKPLADSIEIIIQQRCSL